MRTLSLLLTVVASLLTSSVASASIAPRAQALLDRAEEAILVRGDHAAALEAYIEAVNADARAADLRTIARFAPSDGYSRDDRELLPYEKRPRVLQLHLQALRQYRELHPDDAEALMAYTQYASGFEADAELTEWLSRNPRDVNALSMRGRIRGQHGNVGGAIADLETAAGLDAANAERHYLIGVVAYEATKFDARLTPGGKRELIETGIAALERAESLRADYFEAIVYRSHLIRFLAELADDDATRAKWTREADALRERAVAILNSRKLAASDEAAAPLPVGNGVKAPRLVERVEPVYPEVARKARVAGIVILEIVVDRQGRVREARAMKGLPFGMTEAALEAVKQWKFHPGTRDGEPVDVLYNVTVRFPPEEE